MINEVDIWSQFDHLLTNSKPKNTNTDTNTDTNTAICKHKYIVNDEYATCKDCGKVMDGLISAETEWKCYDKTNIRQRCSKINNIFQSSSLSTVMQGKYGNRKLRMYHKWVSGMDPKERSQLNVFEIIKNVCHRYSLPYIVINQAQLYYKLINDNRISKRDSMKGLPAVCVYYACKKCNYPRTPEEMSSMFCISLTVFTVAKKRFREVLCDIDYKDIPFDDTIEVKIFLPRFCHLLGLSYDMVNIIKRVIKNAQHLGCADNKRPISLAAGVIYLVVKEYNFNVSKESIGSSCKVSPATIYLTYCELVKYSDLLIGKCIKL